MMMMIDDDDQGCSYGGRRRAAPPTTYDFRPAPTKNKKFRPAQNAWHYVLYNRGSIIAQYTLYTLKMTLSGSESLPGH